MSKLDDIAALASEGNVHYMEALQHDELVDLLREIDATPMVYLRTIVRSMILANEDMGVGEPCRWAKVADAWCVKVPSVMDAVEAGHTVSVMRANGDRSEVQLLALVSALPDESRLFSVVPKPKRGRRNGN